MAARRPHVGIDLGTTFSSLAYVDESGGVETLRLADGTFQVPSVVYCAGENEVAVGNEALKYSSLAPERAARAFKRHMGDPNYHFSCDGRSYRPEELSALILKRLLAEAAAKIGPVDRAVISVPFVFDELRRQATVAAGKIAGLEKVDLIDEPVAAALAYGNTLIKSGGFYGLEDVYADETVLVYDLGGGTFDATVMRLGHDGSFRVVATGGDERLGGEDWDKELTEILCDRCREKRGADPHGDAELVHELRLLAIEAKKTLSERPRAEVRLGHGSRQDVLAVTRGEFEERTAGLLARTEHTLSEMLERQNLSWSHVDRVLVVGGSSRMPMVGKMLERVTGRLLDMSLPPDTAIATGAALYGAHRAGQANSGIKEVRTVNSHALGLFVRNLKTSQSVNDVLLKANEPTLTRVTRQYRIPPGKRGIDLRILLGDAPDPEACAPLGRGQVRDLPADLAPQDRLEVSFCFQETGLLRVEALVRRADGGTMSAAQFDLVVEGKMSEDAVAAAADTLRGIDVVG